MLSVPDVASHKTQTQALSGDRDTDAGTVHAGTSVGVLIASRICLEIARAVCKSRTNLTTLERCLESSGIQQRMAL
jgi:hypothetical protein